jgi:hypothetical protein
LYLHHIEQNEQPFPSSWKERAKVPPTSHNSRPTHLIVLDGDLHGGNLERLGLDGAPEGLEVHAGRAQQELQLAEAVGV